jgi:hypothetical protein
MLRRIQIAAAAVLVAAALPVLAQALDRPTLYRLDRNSTFQRGCFPPCMCPLLETAPVTGTFVLDPITVGDVFDFYTVRGVRLAVHRTNADVLPITGSGAYAVSTLADLQRMDLDLVVGDEPPTVYRADDVPGGALFPRIAIAISIHGGFCWDTVIDLRARPARRLRVEPDAVAWDADPNSAGVSHELVQGDLRTLLATGGSFEEATSACLADATASTACAFGIAPEAGEGFWFLERAEGDGYDDEDAAQVGSPDPGIAGCPVACP